MRNKGRLGVGLTLGAMTAAAALLVGTPGARADGIPGFLQVPGTQTQLLITGSVGTRAIYDIGPTVDYPGNSPTDADVIVPFLIPVKGEEALHDNFHFTTRDTSFGFITVTPTSMGKLETVAIFSAGGSNVNDPGQISSGFRNVAMVVGYGTLGPFSAGVNGSLFGDDDAVPEHIEPFGFLAGNIGKLTPGARYTWAGPAGWTVAVAAEDPWTDGIVGSSATNGGVGNWNNLLVSGNNAWGPAPVYTSGSLGGNATIPDFVAKVRWDQPWGHLALAGIVHQANTSCQENCTDAELGPLPKYTKTGWGINLTGHWNTWGKDSLKAGFAIGNGLGQQMGDFDNTGLIVGQNAAGTGWGSAVTPLAWSVRASYTHFWTDSLRSSIAGGYGWVDTNAGGVVASFTNSCNVAHAGAPFGCALTQNLFIDKSHASGMVNLIWSPVPKVDLGVEYVYFQRIAFAPVAFLGYGTKGEANRITGEAVFHF